MSSEAPNAKLCTSGVLHSGKVPRRGMVVEVFGAPYPKTCEVPTPKTIESMVPPIYDTRAPPKVEDDIRLVDGMKVATVDETEDPIVDDTYWLVEEAFRYGYVKGGGGALDMIVVRNRNGCIKASPTTM